MARGKNRDIYAHPHDATALVKVVNPGRQAKERQRGWIARRLKPSYQREYMCEILAVYRALRRAPDSLPRLPILEAAGLAATSKGPGMLTERITDETGANAPTLRDLIDAGGLDQRMLSRLNAFVDAMFTLRIVAEDFDPTNIVWDFRTESFVMVDGFGKKPIVPIHVWSRRLNEAQLAQAISRRLAGRTGLHWDGRTRALSA